MDETSAGATEPPQVSSVEGADVLLVGVARHRRHRFPARTESARARYDEGEMAVVAAAAARAGMTPSGYVAATALAVASDSLTAGCVGGPGAARRAAAGAAGGAPLRGERQPGHRRAALRRWGAGVAARAAASCDRAVAQVDELTALLLQRRS